MANIVWLHMARIFGFHIRRGLAVVQPLPESLSMLAYCQFRTSEGSSQKRSQVWPKSEFIPPKPAKIRSSAPLWGAGWIRLPDLPWTSETKDSEHNILNPDNLECQVMLGRLGAAMN